MLVLRVEILALSLSNCVTIWAGHPTSLMHSLFNFPVLKIKN